MITVEEAELQAAETLSPNWPDTAHGTGAVADSALMATLASRLHCRTPMKRLDWQEGIATYRCMCGFTMDVPSLALDYAVAS